MVSGSLDAWLWVVDIKALCGNSTVLSPYSLLMAALVTTTVGYQAANGMDEES